MNLFNSFDPYFVKATSLIIRFIVFFLKFFVINPEAPYFNRLIDLFSFDSEVNITIGTSISFFLNNFKISFTFPSLKLISDITRSISC